MIGIEDVVLMLPESYDLPENVGFSELLTLDKPKTGKTLTDSEIELLKKCISAAERTDHTTGIGTGKRTRPNVLMLPDGKKIMSGDLNFDVKMPGTDIKYPHLYYLDNLMMVILPDGIDRIEEDTFMCCNNLIYIHIPRSVQYIGSKAFEGCTFAKENFVNDSALDAEVNGYWGATIVEREIDGMLIDCKANVVTLVGTRKGIYTTFTIPSDVEIIGENAFINSSSLNLITIPYSVKGIGKGAFYYCDELKEIVCHAMTPPHGMDEAFSMSSPNNKLKVYVPQGAVAAYQADADWGKFTIQTIP